MLREFKGNHSCQIIPTKVAETHPFMMLLETQE